MRNSAASFFYFLKYFEYFFLFFMVANVMRERRQAAFFLKVLLAVAVVVSLCAYGQLMMYGSRFRVTAPFEGPHAEPNTLAGYLVLMMGVAAGLALHAPRAPHRTLYLVLLGVMVLPFMYTYSRGGYLAFVTMYLALCAFSTRYKPLLIAGLIVGALLIPLVLPETVFERLASTFDPRSAVQFGGYRLSASPAARILAWRLIVNQWQEHPLLGFGITGVGLVDNQYALVIGEIGLIGMAAFLWVRWRLLAISYRVMRTVDDPMAKGLALGLSAGLIGLLVHAFAGNIFIIVRIMEPFWFLAAMVVVLPQVLPAPQPPAVAASAALARQPLHVSAGSHGDQ